MKRFVIVISLLVLVGACDVLNLTQINRTSEGPETVSIGEGVSSGAPAVPKSARTAEAFDTTTAEQRAAAVQTGVQTSGVGFLGETIASLGNPADGGIWLLTPLVDKVQTGRVQYGEASIALELRPITGQPTGASQLSLPAMRLLQAPLTELVRIDVFTG